MIGQRMYIINQIAVALRSAFFTGEIAVSVQVTYLSHLLLLFNYLSYNPVLKVYIITSIKGILK